MWSLSVVDTITADITTDFSVDDKGPGIRSAFTDDKFDRFTAAGTSALVTLAVPAAVDPLVGSATGKIHLQKRPGPRRRERFGCFRSGDVELVISGV
jgi:hypothetical protein